MQESSSNSIRTKHTDVQHYIKRMFQETCVAYLSRPIHQSVTDKGTDGWMKN